MGKRENADLKVGATKRQQAAALQSRLPFLHCYPEEPPRHSSFFKFLNLENLVSLSQMLNFAAIEEMHDESPNLVHILAAMGSGSVMSVPGMPNSVDAKPARPQNAPDFSGEVFQFGCGESHAKEHVRIARIEMVVWKRKRISDVMASRGDGF